MEPKKNPSKDVHRYSGRYFLIGLCISIALCIMAFEWETEIERARFHEPFWPEPLILPYAVPVVIADREKKPEPRKTKPINLVPQLETSVSMSSYEETPIEPELVEGPVPFDIEEPPVEAVDTSFVFVEKMPAPVGGYKGFYTFLTKNMKYPSLAKRKNTEGKVWVEFVIDKTGMPTQVKVLHGIGDGCNEEAIRVVKLTQWEPGKQRGIPVNVKMTLPIYFKLQ